MSNDNNLQRFINAQENDFETALNEIKNGRKRSHWMWYIFPQIQGLGFSETARFYAIKDASEAEAFLAHPILGKRLVAICEELLKLSASNPAEIFGTPDDMKLRSSMTLFAAASNANPVFTHVLTKFFYGQPDNKTLQLLGYPQ